MPLFLAVILAFASGCTPSSNQAPATAEIPAPSPQPSTAHQAAPAPEAGPLPDFSSANEVDAGAATPDESMYAQENPPPAHVPAGVDADDVREAVFRHMFGNNASGQQRGAHVICLAIESDQDPTPGFIARLKDVKTLLRAQSDCSMSADQGVVDKKTHARGLLFRIDGIVFKDAKHATVNGGYYEAGLSASGNVYTVERRASGWVVTKDEMMWIS